VIKRYIPYVIAAGIGLLALLLIAPAGPDQEHWDNPIYWTFAYPAICITCAALGYLFPPNAWTYGFIATWAQALPALITSLDAELFAVSIYLLGFVSTLPALAGFLGGWIGRRYPTRLA
jgi:hypothetical protein